MARWRLTNKHYLNVPGIKWERDETTSTGRRNRISYGVPLYLDPETEGDWTHRPDAREPGLIVVALSPSADGRDIVFEGLPTPDMEPLDDEAREITDSMGWDRRRIIQGADFGEDLITLFMKQQAEALAVNQKPQSNDDLREAVAALTKTMTTFIETQSAPAGGLRRV